MNHPNAFKRKYTNMRQESVASCNSMGKQTSSKKWQQGSLYKKKKKQ